MDKMIIAGYGLLMIIGAFMGLKAGSKISLYMGLASGALVFLGLYLMYSSARTGLLFLSVIGGALSIVFLMRFLKTYKAMPSGMLLAISLLFAIYCVLRYVKA